MSSTSSGRITATISRGVTASAPGRSKRSCVAAAVAEQEVGGAEESRDEARARPRVQLVGAADFEQAALVHDADAVGHREGLVLVVRDEDGRDAELLLDLADRAPQFLADLGVERAERLVEQQHLGPVGERARDRDALLLAARELGRQALVHALERDELQQLLRAGPGARRGCMRRTRSANSTLSATLMWRNSA